MKSKFYLAFILAGIAPVVGLAGFYLYTALSETPSTPGVSAPTVTTVNTAQQQSEVVSIASSLLNAIRNTNVDAATLVSRHSEADMNTFMSTHNGVIGVVLLSPTGRAVRTVPLSPPLVDANYGTNPEFTKITEKFQADATKNYQFYTTRLGYPAFVFAVPLPNNYSAQAVLSIKSFFRGSDANGQYFIVDASSGQFLYHSDASKLGTLFNPQHEPWLNAVQEDLAAHKNGVSAGSGSGAAYGYLGFGNFGVVHTFPLMVASGAKPAAKAAAAQNDLADIVISPMGLGFVLALSLLCIGAAIASRTLSTPFRRAVNVILAAAEDHTTLTPDVVRSFGNDEAGQIIQALSLYSERVQNLKETAVRNLNDQLSGLQRQSRQYQVESQEKNQQVSDKLRELDALKGMAEGLRNQNEQAKTENAKLKGDLATAQTVQLEFTALQNKYTQLQAQLKTVEAKAAEQVAQAKASASTIQVSQVRAAAIRTMSEELKNTLGIIKGYVSSVIGAGQGGINEKQQEFLGMVINRSARLEKFINDLVDIYQVEIETKDAKTEEVNLASEIETFAFNFQTQTELKNLKFKVEAKPGLPKVAVVRRRLTQLWNVIYLQLIKDAPKGSTIPIILESSGDNVKVTLNDPGLIVNPDALPRLFDEFYDPKHPASPQLAGTGLKMALVKTILSAHGGSAIAEKADIGTRLILTFGAKPKAGAVLVAAPAATAPAAAKPAAPVAAPSAAPAAAKSAVDLDAAFGVTPAVPKPPVTAPSSIPSVPGITVGAKPPAVPGAATPSAIPPMQGLSIGSKPPMGDGPAGGLPPLPPIPGLVVGAKPPSSGTPAPAAPPAPGVAPKPPSGAGVLDALISGKIPSVTAPGLKPAVPSAPAAPAVPAAPKVPTPAPPAVPPAGAPKPPATGSLESLLNMKPPTPPGAPKPKSNDGDMLE